MTSGFPPVVGLLSLVTAWTNAFSLTVLPGPSATSTTTTTNNSDALNATVFVAGLKKPCNRQVLQSCLERDYGKVSNLSILKEKTSRPYAFVTFFNPKDAQMAIADYRNDDDGGVASITARPKSEQQQDELPYQEIKPTKTNSKTDCRNGDSTCQTSNNKLNESKIEFDRRLDMAQCSTVVLHVQRSHLERLHQFLMDAHTSIKASSSPASSNLPIPHSSDLIVGQIVESGTVALLLLQGISSNEILDWVDCQISFPLVGLNKAFSVDPSNGVLRGGVRDILRQWTKEISSLGQDSSTKFRLQVYPPSLQEELLAELYKDDTSNNTPHPSDDSDYRLLSSRLSPAQYTHSLTAVQLWSPTANDSDGLGGLYLTGVSRKRQPPARVAPDNIPPKSVDKILCRAYHKLEEAFFRYGSRYELPKGPGKVAVDCGAAPGGWTQYLLDDNNHSHPTWSCQTIYSIDPGMLNPMVALNPKTTHLQMKVEDALCQLSEKEHHRGGVDIWVSDMCLHQMERQIDILLDAMDKGVVRSGTFFVNTLKCNKGHSKEAFDQQVEGQRRRLEGFTRDVLIIHLLSNRHGERTIIGYAK